MDKKKDLKIGHGKDHEEFMKLMRENNRKGCLLCGCEFYYNRDDDEECEGTDWSSDNKLCGHKLLNHNA